MEKLDTYALKGKKKLRVYQFKLPLYNIYYYIYIGQTMKDAAFYADQDFRGLELVEGIDADTNAQAVRIYHKDHGTQHLMLLFHGMKDPAPIIAHEALHLSWDICERMGIILTPENHEAQAYIMQEVFKSALNAMKDYGKRYKIHINL